MATFTPMHYVWVMMGSLSAAEDPSCIIRLDDLGTYENKGEMAVKTPETTAHTRILMRKIFVDPCTLYIIEMTLG